MPDALPADPVVSIRLPDWLRAPSQDAAFAAGGALALVHLARTQFAWPQALWRARLALMAAGNTASLAGRPMGETDLRDALCQLRPGDHPGPVGEMALLWARLVARPLSPATLARALPQVPPALWAAPRQGAPVAQAARMLQAALAVAPHSTISALAMADAALARASGWDHVVPLLSVGLGARDLRAPDPERACHKALVRAAGHVLVLGADLARRAQALRAVAPSLRAKGAAAAVQVFLTSDAVAPAHLSALMSDRAARRLCDRLVTLGGVRELTGRDMFRLYGL